MQKWQQKVMSTKSDLLTSSSHPLTDVSWTKILFQCCLHCCLLLSTELNLINMERKLVKSLSCPTILPPPPPLLNFTYSCPPPLKKLLLLIPVQKLGCVSPSLHSWLVRLPPVLYTPSLLARNHQGVLMQVFWNSLRTFSIYTNGRVRPGIYVWKFRTRV